MMTMKTTTACVFGLLCGIGNGMAWRWHAEPEAPSGAKPRCDSSPAMNATNGTGDWDVCWEGMMYRKLDLANVTAVFQPASWESAYPDVVDFCSSRGNGTFCYRPMAQMEDMCLDMAVVRCPEGIISSCRSNFICAELMTSNVTCNATVGQLFSANYTESGQAQCQAIEDVLRLPEAQNMTTTVDAMNQTVTVGRQVFGFPFATTTTVDCTVTCISTLPAGMPQPSQPLSACFNPTLPYGELVPTGTCIGPYPPGPMTTVTETAGTETAGTETSATTSATMSDKASSTTSDMASSTTSDMASSTTSDMASSTTSDMTGTVCPTATTTGGSIMSTSSSSATVCPAPSSSQTESSMVCEPSLSESASSTAAPSSSESASSMTPSASLTTTPMLYYY